MNKYQFYLKDKNNGVTVLSNRFIHEYLPYARADQIKVYLFGMMQSQNPDEAPSSLESISFALDVSENDIVKALDYWKDKGLVEIIENGMDHNIYFLHPGESDQVSIKKKNLDLNELVLKQCAEMLGPSYNKRVENHILDWLEIYKFEPNTIFRLIEYTEDMVKNRDFTSMGKLNYLIKVAQTWHEENIKTLGQAEDYIKNHSKQIVFEKKVLNKLGIKNQNLTQRQRDLFRQWKEDYKLSEESILAAAAKSKKSDLFYLDGILRNTYQNPRQTQKENKEEIDQKYKQMLSDLNIDLSDESSS